MYGEYVRRSNGLQTHHLVSRRVRKIAKSEYKLRVCLSTLNSAVPTRRIFTEFGIWVFFEHLSRKFNFD